jgi:hypothetical protein
MARALRIERPGGRYHVTARGNDRKDIFQEEQRAALRTYTKSAVLQGGVEPPWERVVDGIVLGSAAFAQRLRREARGNAREQKALRGAPPAATWAQIVSALEQAKGERWTSFVNRHGDWGRDAALWLGRRAGRLSLAALGKLAGGLDYAVVSKAIARFGRRLLSDVALSEQLAAIQNQLSKGQDMTLRPPPFAFSTTLFSLHQRKSSAIFVA